MSRKKVAIAFLAMSLLTATPVFAAENPNKSKIVVSSQSNKNESSKKRESKKNVERDATVSR